MPWPTPEDVLRTLPLATFEDFEGKLTREDVERYVAKWRRELAQGSPQPAPETEQGVDIVALGARADSLEQAYTGAGYEFARAAQAMRKEAREMLALYKQEVDLPGETEHNDGGGAASVHNVTDEPLW